jgi:hypothetical protein
LTRRPAFEEEKTGAVSRLFGEISRLDLVVFKGVPA